MKNAKINLPFATFGVSTKQCVEAFKKLAKAFRYQRILEKKIVRYNRSKRCVLIAFALSQTCSPKKKWILWNLFKKVEL